MVTKEVAAMAVTEGGGGATVMPIAVKPKTRRDNTEIQSFLGLDNAAPDTKR